MSGIVQVGGVALASHDSVSDKVSLDSGTVFPAGHVLKVQSAIHTAKADLAGATTADNYADVPGLSISSFTTTGSNTVFLTATLSVGGSDSMPVWFRFLRGATPVGVGTAADSSQSSATARIRTGASANQDQISVAMSAMDSPGAGTHTYKVQWQTESSATATLNQSILDSDNYVNASTSSNLTVMEIKA